MSIVSLDLETTGLDERIHEAWEVAAVAEDGSAECWQFPLRKRIADASDTALEIGGFHARYHAELGLAWDGLGTHLRPRTVAQYFAEFLDGATLMGCSISFDMRFLTDLLRDCGVEPTWHHRALDLGSYIAGMVGAAEPLSSARMAELVPNPEAHTALGDARWNWTVYRRYYADANAN